MTSPHALEGTRARDWTPSPELVRVRLVLHGLTRVCNTSWCVVHPDGPLRSSSGRVVAASLLFSQCAQVVLLREGVLDTPRGRLVRNVIDTVETVAAMAVYPASGNEGGFATAMLPAAGTAVERAYTETLRGSLRGLVLPTLAGAVARWATGRPTTVADLVTTPTIAFGAVVALRQVERRGRRSRERREARRASAARRAAEVMGGYACKMAGGITVLDHLKNQISVLRLAAPGPAPTLDRLKGLAVADREAALEAKAQFGSHPEMLASVLHSYQQARNRSEYFDDHMYLVEDEPAHDLQSEDGSLLLDEGQVRQLVRILDEMEVGGDTAVRVLATADHGPGQDVRLLIATTQGGPATGPAGRDVILDATVGPWRLDVVPTGLALQALWMLSVCSPAHAHVPLRTVLPWTVLNLGLAATSQRLIGRRRVAVAADLAPLCLLGTTGVAAMSPRAMRRPVFTEGGTPFHPGLHALTGCSYLLGVTFSDMRPATRALTVVGATVTAAATWGASRKQPGDGAGFLAEVLWPVSAAIGAGFLSRGVRRMTIRIDSELAGTTSAAARGAFRRSWSEQIAAWRHMAELTDLYAEQLRRSADESLAIAPDPFVADVIAKSRASGVRVRRLLDQLPTEPPAALFVGGPRRTA